MKIFFSEECLKYGMPGHPESPERVLATYNLLKGKKFPFARPEPCREEDLLRVHSREMVEEVRSERFTNMETPSLPNIFGYACLSAGSAIMAMQSALAEEDAFSLMRPPGHHAGKSSFEGFCYFNNIAVAIAKSLERVKKTAILDIDVHHGQGTQEIFLGNKKVIYLSLHEYGYIYPGTGGSSGDNYYNFPLNAGTEEKGYMEKLNEAIQIIKKFNPDLIGVSAGFDTFGGDPLAHIKLETESYGKIAKMIKQLDKPNFTVLEGGYSKSMPGCVFSYLQGLK